MKMSGKIIKIIKVLFLLYISVCLAHKISLLREPLFKYTNLYIEISTTKKELKKELDDNKLLISVNSKFTDDLLKNKDYIKKYELLEDKYADYDEILYPYSKQYCDPSGCYIKGHHIYYILLVDNDLNQDVISRKIRKIENVLKVEEFSNYYNKILEIKNSCLWFILIEIFKIIILVTILYKIIKSIIKNIKRK